MQNFGAKYKVPPKPVRGGQKNEGGQGSKSEKNQGTKRPLEKQTHQSPPKKRSNQTGPPPSKDVSHVQIGSSGKTKDDDPKGKGMERRSEETGSPQLPLTSTFHPKWCLKKISTMLRSSSVEMCRDFCLAPVLPQDKKMVDKMKDHEVLDALLHAESQVRTLTGRMVRGFEERVEAKEALRNSERLREMEKDDHKLDLEAEQEKMKRQVAELNNAHKKALETARSEAVQSYLLSEEFFAKKREIEEQFCLSETYAEKVWGSSSNFYDYAFEEVKQQLAEKNTDLALDLRLGLPKLFAFHGVPGFPIIPSHDKYQNEPDWILSREMMKNFKSPEHEEEQDQDDEEKEQGGGGEQGDEGQNQDDGQS